jgi:hypothetical protein
MDTSTTTIVKHFDTSTRTINLEDNDVYQDTSMVKLPKLKVRRKLFSDSNDSMLNDIRERMNDS